MKLVTVSCQIVPCMLLLLTACIGLLSIVHAEDFSANGSIETTNKHNVQALAENQIVLLASMEEKLVMDDIKSPWHGTQGPCGGSVAIIAGEISGNGLCAFTDTAGDNFVIPWTVKKLNEEGGPMGVWELTGGTGCYTGATGSGGYSDIPSDEPTKGVVVLSGTLSIKQSAIETSHYQLEKLSIEPSNQNRGLGESAFYSKPPPEKMPA